MVNLLIMCFNWSAALFSYHLLFFYVKYLPGDLYENSLMQSVSVMVGGWLSVILMQQMGVINSFSILYGLSLIGSSMIYAFGEKYIEWMPMFVLFTQVGISGLY